MTFPTRRGDLRERLEPVRSIFRGAGRRLHSHRHEIGNFGLLGLRFGQLVAAVVIAVVYCIHIDAHLHHYCHYYPSNQYCWSYRRAGKPQDEVPWEYIVVLLAAIFSFLQLFLTTAGIYFAHPLLQPRATTPSAGPQTTKLKFRPHLRRHVLLWYTDLPVLAFYIVAFICLSDYVVPTHILLSVRRGTSCFSFSRNNVYQPVVEQQCVLGQHGYWFTMGAMLSYLITTVLWAVYWVEEYTLKRVVRAIERRRSGNPAEGEAEEPLISLE